MCVLERVDLCCVERVAATARQGAVALMRDQPLLSVKALAPHGQASVAAIYGLMKALKACI